MKWIKSAKQESWTWAQILVRIGVFLLVLSTVLVIWLSNLYFTERFTRATRVSAEKQISLYSGRIISEIQRSSIVPLLLSRDTTLVSALDTEDYALASQRLISYQGEIGAKSVVLLDKDGRTVAATDRRELGTLLRDKPFFHEALRQNDTVFTTTGVDDLDRLFDTWSGANATIIVTNSEGRIILSTERQFEHKTLTEALSANPPRSAYERAIRATNEWSQTLADSYVRGRPLYRLDTKIPFQGWQLSYLTSFDAVRARVNGLLALEITAIAMIIALSFYILSRRAIRQSFLFKAESEQLRALNERLSNEIAERERVEQNLRVAEQSLAQSSKLAALGEMSAAVSHELNQPLAAMRTYLAGAKLLIKRRRPDEALSSFQRIDDLISRMGAITKQLKSYARKGGDDLVQVDFRDAVNASLSLMAPQLSQMMVEISVTLPKKPVIVLADQVRLEQVIVNLLRNALDAMKSQEHRELEVVMIDGETARLYVRDNGTGIENLDELFEPFFTTKKPGEGVGLGLAISSGIANDLGGRLLARNVKPQGAEFEFLLPQIQTSKLEAAE
jgi:two-component system C4-dicarboxylate transport sensor histidine kinase DctB